MKLLFSEGDYRQLKDDETYKDKFVIVDPNWFSESYRTAKNQLFFARGGFGCDPCKLGSAVFGKFWDEDARIERHNILGVATDDAVAEWERVYGLNVDVVFK